MDRTFARSLCAALALIAAPAAAQHSDPNAVAAAALKAAPVFDGHNDMPWQVRARAGNMLAEFDFADTTNRSDPGRDIMHTDITRLRAGRVGAQFWVTYVPTSLPEPQAVLGALEQIDVTKRIIARYPGDLALVTTAAGVEAEMKRGRVAGVLAVEGGYMLGSSLAVLRQFHALGVRYLTLTHIRNIGWADSGTDAPAVGGLNDFGRNVIREMNRLGMIVDLSHVAATTMRDALAVSTAPVVFTHSGVMAVTPHPRNVPDDVLPLVKANGGLVMVVFYPAYVSKAVWDWESTRAAQRTLFERQFVGNPAGAAQALAAWQAANPAPRATVAQVADHIDHLKRTIGVDHIGIGGDFDGMDVVVQGLEDAGTYPVLFAELARRGYAQAELMKISSGNMLRVMRAVEARAAALADQPPIETPIAR